MKDLAYSLKNLCRRNPVGSYGTQTARARGLSLIAAQLEEAGYKLKTAQSLKPKHIEALVARWMGEDLSAGTIKNRLGHIRFWAEGVNKASILRDNAAYGVPNRVSENGSKARTLDMDKLSLVSCDAVKLALQLQAAFGLRREEAIKFMPAYADRGDHIQLKPTWTKGGRPRSIPVQTERQRALLDEVAAYTGSGSLIPPEKSYVQQLKTYEHQTRKQGLINNHGLRHAYAQSRYKQLAGFDCGIAGGKYPSEMNAHEQALDHAARLTVSRELGHDRKSVVRHYLGRAKP